jgi:hypothetical protein
MAAWQADFTLEPDLRALPADFRDRLDQLLPRGKAWSKLQETWGAEDGTRIDVWHDPRGATEVVLRVDVRSLDATWLERVLAFAHEVGRKVQTPDGRVIGGDLGEFMLALRGTPAWRFVQDPEAYLRRVRLGGHEDA